MTEPEHVSTPTSSSLDGGSESLGERAERVEAAEPTLNDQQLASALEALLMLVEEPTPAHVLAEATGCPVERVTTSLITLANFYDETGRGFELRQVGGGWRYWTRPQHAELIGRWVLSGQQAKLSQAALETLSVVAYLQPISRTRVSAVRGVSVDGVIRTLTARGLIEEAGRDEETGAVVFRTTDYFLERMGLESLDQLPPLAPHLPEASDLEAELASLTSAKVVPADAELGERTGGSDDSEAEAVDSVELPDDLEHAESASEADNPLRAEPLDSAPEGENDDR